MDLTDEQWKIVETILPPDRVRADRRGRPWSDRRTTLNGILWILRTGAPWKDLPERYGAYQTVHRRFQNWVRSKVLEQVLLAVAQDLKDRGGLDLRECFIMLPPRPRRTAGIQPRSASSGAKIVSKIETGNSARPTRPTSSDPINVCLLV